MSRQVYVYRDTADAFDVSGVEHPTLWQILRTHLGEQRLESWVANILVDDLSVLDNAPRVDHQPLPLALGQHPTIVSPQLIVWLLELYGSYIRRRRQDSVRPATSH
jgi:hypothetical protein